MQRRLYDYELAEAIGPGVYRATDVRSGEHVVVHEWKPVAADLNGAKQRLDEAAMSPSAKVFTADGSFYLVTASMEEASPVLAELRGNDLFRADVVRAPQPIAEATAPLATVLPPVDRAASPQVLRSQVPPRVTAIPAIDTVTALPVKKPRSLILWLGGWVILLLGWWLLRLIGTDSPRAFILVFVVFAWWYAARARRRRRT